MKMLRQERKQLGTEALKRELDASSRPPPEWRGSPMSLDKNTGLTSDEVTHYRSGICIDDAAHSAKATRRKIAMRVNHVSS